MPVSIIDRINKDYKTPIKVIFDECHGESWSISIDVARQINPANINNCSYHKVAKLLKENGYEIERLSIAPIKIDKLNNCDIFVIVHPTDGNVCKNTKGSSFFDDDEINNLVKWVSEGGSLFVLYEYETDKWGSNINALLKKFDMCFENTVLFDRYHNVGNNPSNVVFKNIKSNHKILSGVDQVIYYAGSTIKIDGTAEGILVSDQDSDPPYAPVIACNKFNKGRVVVIGDTDLFDPVKIKDADHTTLLINIFNWLSTDKPSIMVEQDFFLFSDNRIVINWQLQNTSEMFFDTVNIFGYDKKVYLSDTQMEPGEVVTFKSTHLLKKNNIKPTIGKCCIDYKCDNKIKEFDIEGAKLNYRFHSKESVSFECQEKEDFTKMAMCPLNHKMCAIEESVLKKHRKYKVFLDIPYGEEYSIFQHAIREVLNKNGLIPVLAKDNASGKILLCNICEEIQSCSYAIADLKGFRGNILYELGLIHALGKRCAILKPKEFDKNLGDITGLVYIDYETPEKLKEELDIWIKQQILR